MANDLNVIICCYLRRLLFFFSYCYLSIQETVPSWTNIFELTNTSLAPPYQFLMQHHQVWAYESHWFKEFSLSWESGCSKWECVIHTGTKSLYGGDSYRFWWIGSINEIKNFKLAKLGTFRSHCCFWILAREVNMKGGRIEVSK